MKSPASACSTPRNILAPSGGKTRNVQLKPCYGVGELGSTSLKTN
jgi:hypothetical protein